jgi:hypothetical protein
MSPAGAHGRQRFVCQFPGRKNSAHDKPSIYFSSRRTFAS